MNEEEKKELFRKISELQKDIQLLKTELNQVNSQKEAAFESKDKYSKEINNLIEEIKKNKKERDEIRKKVKEDKTKRDELNKDISEKIKKIKEVNAKKADIQKKYKIEGDPSNIKKQIDALEFKIETEGMSFEKEKKVMKTINELQKKYKEAKKISSVWEESNKSSKDIDEVKKKAEDMHKRVQNNAKKGQEDHESIISNSKKIDELRKLEEESFKNFIQAKMKFNTINDKLKEKLTELGKLNESVKEFKVETRREKKHREEQILKKQEANVEEKIKKRQKITTEDLLIFQKGN